MRRLALGVLLLTIIGCAMQPEPVTQTNGSETFIKPVSAGSSTADRSKNAPFHVKLEYPGAAADLEGDWLAVQNGDQLTVHNMKTGRAMLIPTRGRLWGGFALGGSKIVWSDLRNDPHVRGTLEPQAQPNLWNWDIMVMDLVTGKVSQVTRDHAAQWNPHTDGSTIVWEDFRHDTSSDLYGYPDIYSYDIQTGNERRLTFESGGHFRPRADAGKVVWMDGRNNPKTGWARGCGSCPDNNWDIYGYDLDADREFTVATSLSMDDSPDISGDNIVWIERGKGDQVWVLNLGTSKQERVTEVPVARGDARIDGSRVVWMDTRRGHSANDVIMNGQEGNSDIFLYDLTARQEVRLTGDWIQMQPVISGTRVAFVYSTQINPLVQLVDVP